MKKSIFLSMLMTIISIAFSTNVFALTFALPSNGDAVIGKTQWTQSRPGDNFSKLGRRYDVGYFELVEANPGIDPDHLKPNTLIVVPTKFIIPNVPRTGVVLNTAELRVYYFPQGTHSVITFPVGIGREGWDTPLGITTVVRKAVNPTWTPTENIRKWHLETLGNTLPAKVLAGPGNPLGGYAMYLGFPTILMHGTNDPTGIGRRSSSGCIRIWPEDVEDLFSHVKIGTPVRVIDTPYKAGWLDGKVYLEAHVPLQEKSVAPMRYDVESITTKRAAEINWNTADRVVEQQNGIAQMIGEAR